METFGFYPLLFILFIVSIIINQIYWMVIFPVLLRSSITHKKKLISQPSVSVIISAKNEAQNLQQLIPLILSQDYPIYELIIANDCSTDNTINILNSFSSIDNFRFINISKDKPGKKHALKLAIDSAKYEHLLFTDADCRPMSELWIKTMIHQMKNKSLVLGYGPILKTSTWLNKYIRFETFLTAIQYLSYAKWNHAYMGVGRNMMYTKSLFIKNNAYDGHEHISSGDDDLFVNALSNPSDVSISIVENSFMYSSAKTTLKGYYRQKTRHFSTSSHYRWIDKLTLGIFAISHILIYSLFFILLYSSYWKPMLIIMIFRLILIMSANKRTFSILKVPDLWIYFPILDFFNYLFYILFIPSVLFPKRNRW